MTQFTGIGVLPAVYYSAKKCRRYNSISMEFKEVSVTKYRIMLRSSKFSNRDRKSELEVCALCGDADPRRVCRELHFV